MTIKKLTPRQAAKSFLSTAFYEGIQSWKDSHFYETLTSRKDWPSIEKHLDKLTRRVDTLLDLKNDL